MSAEARAYPGGTIVVSHRQNGDGSESRFFQVWLQQGSEWKMAVQHGVRGSTRVYADLAATNRITRNQTGRTATTIVHVRQNGKWLRAGIAFTAIVG